MIPAPLLEVAVVVMGLLALCVEAFATKLDRRYFAYASILGLIAVLVGSFYIEPAPAAGSAMWDFYALDRMAVFFKQFALVTTILVIVLMIDYAPVVRTYIQGASPQAGLGEFFSLPLLTCAGLMWMASAVDFVMIFVSLELVTISFYVLVSFTRRNTQTLEAGVKYLILSALSTGFLVYGITWIFGVTGETNLERIAEQVAQPNIDRAPILFGLLLVFASLGFKIAAVPFQLWVPDVYQGAPTPVTAYLSVGSKAAGFVVLMRVMEAFLIFPRVQALLGLIAGLTLIYGNLAALPQMNMKRLLAYSSIAHAGYLLVGVVCFAGTAVTFYLVAYLLMTLLGFAVLIIVAQTTGEQLQDFNGLSRRSPLLAFAMLISMISLAGVPFTAGFFGKFLIFDAAVQAHQTTLIVIGVITVGCGFYYYLKVVRAMYWETSPDPSPIAVSSLTRFVIIGMIIATIWLGVYPRPVLKALDAARPAAALNR